MKITNLATKSPEPGDLIIFHDKKDEADSLVRIMIKWGDEGEVVLFDPEEGRVTTGVFPSFDKLYRETFAGFYEYTVIDKSKLELIIHN